MSDEDIEEMAALVIGFLQQTLKDHPDGMSIRDFERLFVERSLEPPDWYKQYKMNSVLDCLKRIPDDVILSNNNRFHTMFVKLNMKSKKVDRALVDLIMNQKSTNKKKRPAYSRPSSRALTSFSLNRQYSKSYNTQHYRSRLNQEPRSDVTRKSPEVRSSLYKTRPFTAAPNDPRASSSQTATSPSPMVPPQVKPTIQKPKESPAVSSPSPAVKPVRPQPSNVTLTTSRPSKVAATIVTGFEKVPRFSGNEQVKQSTPKVDDQDMVQKKSYLRQRLVYLLRKHSEIMLLYLNDYYQKEFEDKIDPAKYNHTSLTELFRDPLISHDIKLNIKPASVTISINKKSTCGKENKNDENINVQQSNGISDDLNRDQLRYHAIEPFNLTEMSNNLERISMPEPQQTQKAIDDIIIYKTIRMIYNSEKSTMKLDDWESRFEQESRLRFKVRDFGFRTSYEFFKKISQEAPINTRLDKDNNWIATVSMTALSEYVNQELSKGHYKAIIALNVLYESAALPGETFSFDSFDEVMKSKADYYPTKILSPKRSNCIWVSIKEPKRIENHLSIEASMTCYEDYREKALLSASRWFIKPGFACAVFDTSQQRWCRGLVYRAPELINKNYEIEVLLVDYGIIKNIPCSKILCLLRSHLKRPVGPIYARLDENNCTSSTYPGIFSVPQD